MSYRRSSLRMKDAVAATTVLWMPWISTLAYCQQSPRACGAGSGECCSANRTPGCQAEACCAAVCTCDPFCCFITWDEACATTGEGGNGCGAAILCGICVDSDGDGVNDEIDMCCDTPAGLTVDQRGRPLGDLDLDCDVDLDDFSLFQGNLSGALDAIGACCAVSPDLCDDGVTCTVDACDPVAGCRSTPDHGLCDDGNACTADACDSNLGSCLNEPVVCAPGMSCNPTTGECVAPPCQSDADCDDGLLCNGSETCVSGACTPGTNPCGNGYCDEVTGTCYGLRCQSDADCDDSLFCNGAEICESLTGNCWAGRDPCSPGEVCDEGSDTCEVALQNDSCANPIAVSDGATSFSNEGATTDGPEEPACNFPLSEDQVGSDVWYCYTATCSDEVAFSLCGSPFDTKMTVYDGCDCPTATPISCSDDDCGIGGLDSRIAFQATAGESYLIRIGGFEDAQGTGDLTIRCGVDTCGPDRGDCRAQHEGAGCGDAECCATVCDVDAFCCDVAWDEFCAGEAVGLCDGNFEACEPDAGACDLPSDSGGCEDAGCCNRVCAVDPFCCVDHWDDLCAEAALFTECFLVCGPGAGECFRPEGNGSAGCEDRTCCESVCTEDPICCEVLWDEQCAVGAAILCR